MNEEIDASGLPPLSAPAHRGPDGTGSYFDSWTAEQVRQAQRDAVASRDAEIADLRAQLAQTERAYRSVIEMCRGAAHALLAARDMVGHPDNVAFIDRALANPTALVDGGTPTQPKAQVGASIDTPEFRNLLGDMLDAYRKELQGGPMLPYEKARPKLIAYIDAWAGSRSAPAAGTVEKDAERPDFLKWWTSIETDLRKSMLVGARRDPERLHALLRMTFDAAIEAHNRAGKEQG